MNVAAYPYIPCSIGRGLAALLVTASCGAMGVAQAQTAKPQAATPAPAGTSVAPESETIIVTGVAIGTQARKANVSYSVLTADEMTKFTPISADDMLRDLPGVVVETNDGVARNEVFTRGMTIGTGANTSGYFWTTILEDGLPVVPFKFSGFQDGYFYRSDITTGRVESVRGGSSATGVTTSVGATFNYLTDAVKPGGAIQARFGFEGADTHLSWKQIDAKVGFVNKAGDAGVGIGGFYRVSNGEVNPGYNLNQGGQFKIQAFKNYDTGNGSGSFTFVYKHLDDTNAELTAFAQPAYGYQSPTEIPGFGRSANLWLKGGQKQVPNYFSDGTHSFDPSEAFRYRQDAAWLRWTHKFDNGLNLAGVVRFQNSRYRGQGYKPQSVVSLASSAAARERYGLNVNNLDRQPGYYVFTDALGNQVAKVANNVAGSQLGINYRTGLACPKVTGTSFSSSSSLCIVQNALPNRDIDMMGGLVTSTIPDATIVSGTVPAPGAGQDLVLQTRAEDNYRSSKDFMANFTASYRDDRFGISGGIYVSHSSQVNNNWATGLGLSAWADGQVQNLNVQYVTASGTTYQLTDAGGWGNYASGLFTTVSQQASLWEISPYAEANLSLGNFDFNASIKYQHYKAHTVSQTWDTSNPNFTNLAYGGLDGNPLTVYDNSYRLRTASKDITADRTLGLLNYSLAVGYNFNRNHKIYVRYTNAKNPAMSVISRYSSVGTLVRPLGPTGFIKGFEAAYTFAGKGFSGQITYFRQQFAINDYPTGVDTDGVSTYLLPENFNRYLSKGIEAWAKIRITKRLEWSPSVTYLTGTTQENYTWLNVSSSQPGPEDDKLRVDSGLLSRTPKWTISNTLSYRLGDFRFNLRHRWMDKRKVNANALDTRYLPKQNNTDFSVQFRGMKDTQITFDVRNVFNNQYISAYDPMISTGLPTNVQLYDVVAQLPNSGMLVKRNAPRSFWLTMRHNF